MRRLFAVVLVFTAGAVFGAESSETARKSMWRVMLDYDSRAADSGAGERVLRFSADRSLGSIYVKDADVVRGVESFFFWIDGPQWEYLCQACGDVRIPAGKIARLSVGSEQWRDLSPLARLDPDGLYELSIYGPYEGGPKPTDVITEHIAHLRGLRILKLEQTAISTRGLEKLLVLENLEYLSISDVVTDAWLGRLASLPRLRGLYLGKNRLTNRGLARLKDFPALEELQIAQGRMTDAGLAHLSGCRRLRYLRLLGMNFGDAGMIHMKDIASLRILHAGSLSHMTDAGLAHLSKATQLERLSVHWANGITDAGLEHLSAMPNLKMLDVRHAEVSNAGAAHLGRIRTLENLIVAGKSLNDTGLSHLAKLSKLRKLSVTRPHLVDPSRDKDYYTDRGVAKLVAGCPELEELKVGSLGLTDVGVAEIAKLKKLRQLLLFGAPVTDAGLKEIAKIKSLDNLYIHAPECTVAGLTVLRDLPKLNKLNVGGFESGGAVLDLSGFAELSELSLSLRGRGSDFFDDADLAGLAGCKKLRWLQIGPRKFSDEGMVHLAGLTRMERLGIGGPVLTDAGLAYLSNMKNLNHLSIDDGQFTDEAVRRLEELTMLSYLNLPESPAFSSRVQQRLRANLPNLVSLQVRAKSKPRPKK